MRIASYLNITPEEIAARTRNIYIGISLGNKYFTREHVADYIRWAVTNTKERVIVVLADSIHAINFEVLNSYTPARAARCALQMGDEFTAMIQEIITQLPESDRARVTLARWDEIEQDGTFQKRLSIVMDEWNSNPVFREHVTDIFRAYMQARGRTITPERIERGCQYLLRELPTFFGGVTFHGVCYSLHPYPGITGLALLTVGVQRGELFPELATKLQFTEKIAMVEAYADKNQF